MMLRLPLLTLVAAALVQTAAAGQTPMSAEEFEAYVTGRTLTFGTDGVPYGTEEFREDRRTTWAFMGEECREGVWFERDDYICFAYEDDPQTHCWQFFEGEHGLRARFRGDPPGSELYEIEQSDRPLICPGPQIGA